MAHEARVPVIILIILAVISLALAGGGIYLFQKERVRSRSLEQKLEELNSKQRETEARLKESQNLISEMQARLQQAKSQIEALNNGFQQEKTGRLEALSSIERMRVDLEEQKRLRVDLEKKLSQAQEDAGKTQVRLTQLEARKAELESKLKDLESKSQNVELGNIVIGPDALAPVSEPKPAKAGQLKEGKVAKEVQGAGIEGKVLVINKEYNFAVINLGAKDAVALEDVFSVYHKNKYIGDIKIEKVHDSMAAAGFASAGIKDKISEGDKVVQKVK